MDMIDTAIKQKLRSSRTSLWIDPSGKRPASMGWGTAALMCALIYLKNVSSQKTIEPKSHFPSRSNHHERKQRSEKMQAQILPEKKRA